MEKVMTMTYASSLTDLCSLNSSFDKGVLRVAYHGENRNKSYISKQTFENCIKTMFDCPIVCNYDRDTDTLGGHDMQIVRDAEGSLRVINATTPVGCIPESARYWWDEVDEEDGTVHEYLFVDALLWKRQEAYRKIKSDGITAQSMEITIRDSEKIDGVLHINDFEFTAFALIGVTPCFESAALEMFSSRDFKQQLSEMMHELKESFSLVSPSQEVNDIEQNNDPMEGGEKVLQEKLDLAASYGIDVDTLDFSIEEMELDELAKKFEAMKNAEEQNADNGSTQDENFELNSNMVDEIYRVLTEGEVIHREWGDMPRYSYADLDAELSEVYAWDHENWLLYGFTYSLDGDAVKIDFESKKRMKYAIVPFDEGEQESPFAAAFADMEEKLSANTELDAKFQAASDTIKSMETELGELRQFKADTENAALKGAREKVFAQFEDLVGVEAFEALREDCEQYSDMDALEEKCYAIRGRLGTAAKFAQETLQDEKTPKLMVVKDHEPAKEPYGGIFARYGIEAD